MKKTLLFILLLSPLSYLGYLLYNGDVSDPIKFFYTFTSICAFVILMFTTTIPLFKKWINLLKYRKMIGLFGFFYAFLHLLNFIALDVEFDLEFFVEEVIDKPFVYLGMIAFSLLLFMAITSSKNLFKKYNKYHVALYPAIALVTIHFIMAQKSLSIEQWWYLVIIVVIFILKVLKKTKKLF